MQPDQMKSRCRCPVAAVNYSVPHHSLCTVLCTISRVAYLSSLSSLMRTCPSFSLRAHREAYSLFQHRSTESYYKGSLSFFRPQAALLRKPSWTFSTFAPSFASSAVQRQNGDRLQHAHTVTALYTARELISRILPPQSPGSSFWVDILRETSDEVCRSNLVSNEHKATTIVGAF
jgi:hypothetical protein